MSEPKEPNGGYSVGRGKPPLHTRFKPGHSGNPKGRRKGVRNFKTEVQEMLKAPVRVTRGGKPKYVSTQKAMLMRLCEQAASGNQRALQLFIQLAQAHNNEERTEASNISDDDAMLLAIYTSRIASGAAMRPSNPSAEQSPGKASVKAKCKQKANLPKPDSEAVSDGKENN
jgi:hypothetical protein